MMTLFDVGTSFPVTKSLSFKNKLGNMNLLVHYQEGSKLMKGLPLQLANYTIKEGKMKHADKGSKVEFIIKVENSIHQIAYLQSAELKETWSEMEKIPIKRTVPVVAPEEKKPEEAKPEGEAKPEEAAKEGAEEAPKVPETETV
jgi:hypothetical protein